MSSDNAENDLFRKPIFDKADLLERLDNDEPLLWEIMDTFVEDMAVQIGLLDKAIENKDSALVRSQGHMIKGASGNIGALALQDAAFCLEMAGKDEDLEKSVLFIDQVKEEFQRFRTHVGK